MNDTDAANVILRIRCVDKRYNTLKIMALVCDKLGENAYEFTAPGASLGVLDHDWQTWFRRQLQLLESAKVSMNTVQIVDHFDAAGQHGCLAYGHSDLRERHLNSLKAAAKSLARLPELQHCQFHLFLHNLPAYTFETVPLT